MARLNDIPGVGVTAAHLIVAEVGMDMTRFPTPGHLASWARFAPGVRESAGRKKGTDTTGHGNPYLARVLGEAAVAASKTDTFLGNATDASPAHAGRRRPWSLSAAILTIVWQLLSDPTAEFVDLGANFYDTRMGTERAKRNHIRHLEALCYKVTLEPAA